MSNEKKQNEKKPVVKQVEKDVFTRVQILNSDLKSLELEGKSTREVREAIRTKLALPMIKANTQKAQALAKLGLDTNATTKELWAKLNEVPQTENSKEDK